MHSIYICLLIDTSTKKKKSLKKRMYSFKKTVLMLLIVFKKNLTISNFKLALNLDQKQTKKYPKN